MPFEVGDVNIIPPDLVEFVAAFVTMAIVYVILVVLGRWWAE